MLCCCWICITKINRGCSILYAHPLHKGIVFFPYQLGHINHKVWIVFPYYIYLLFMRNCPHLRVSNTEDTILNMPRVSSQSVEGKGQLSFFQSQGRAQKCKECLTSCALWMKYIIWLIIVRELFEIIFQYGSNRRTKQPFLTL